MSATQSLPKTYKAAEIAEKGAPFKIVEKNLEQPKDSEVLIKVEACGVCHSDVIAKESYFPGIPYPIVPGHEVVGRIVALGSRVNTDFFKVGDRVGTGWEGGHCHECKACRKGAFACCEKGSVNGIFRNGGYAEYVKVREESVVRIPKDIDSAEAAPLLCAGVTVFNALRNTPAHPGDLVAVQGIGGLGHLAIQFAKQSGFRVAALSTSEDKKSLASQLGATYYITGSPEEQAEQLAKEGGAQIIIATAPHAPAIGPLVKGLALDGTLLIVAAAGEVTVDTTAMIMKRLSVRAWASGSAIDSEETIKFALQTGVKCHIEKFKLADVEKAYERMMSNKARFRAVLTME
ncbi:GroES-like protein [Fimicolochytrium jonesii]|uniref:GroES-like protein n=1 Tax=Fimicolochytrium jonesii TaxID=1396493 RepID=UPI0022FF104F|nr:GroES-like protein [Fimicolochytrium jonesii]KAI8823956.1 GroES-like protein [Fimicolochytrium jonesii]